MKERARAVYDSVVTRAPLSRDQLLMRPRAAVARLVREGLPLPRDYCSTLFDAKIRSMLVAADALFLTFNHGRLTLNA